MIKQGEDLYHYNKQNNRKKCNKLCVTLFFLTLSPIFKPFLAVLLSNHFDFQNISFTHLINKLVIKNSCHASFKSLKRVKFEPK